MAEHTFLVTVDVDDHGEEGGDRTTEDYARAALSVASLRDARFLDGFGDLPWEADVTAVQEA